MSTKDDYERTVKLNTEIALCRNILSTSKCRYLKRFHACHTHPHRMKGYCPYTCGFCGKVCLFNLHLKHSSCLKARFSSRWGYFTFQTNIMITYALCRLKASAFSWDFTPCENLSHLVYPNKKYYFWKLTKANITMDQEGWKKLENVTLLN